MNRKLFAVLMMLVALTAICTINVDHAQAGEESQLTLRIYGTSLWNHGWGSKFFIHHGTMQDLITDPDGEIRSWSRTLHHYSGPNLEIKWAKPISRKFAVTVSGKYEHLGFRLGDSFVGDSLEGFPWLRWHEGLDAKLDFLSIGAGLQMDWKCIQPYANAEIGYCLVDLSTSSILEIIDEDVSATMINGHGGGIFYRGTLGVTMPLWRNIGLFAESGYLICGDWKPIPAHEFRVTTDIHLNEPLWLGIENRDISRIRGFEVSLGIVIAVR